MKECCYLKQIKYSSATKKTCQNSNLKWMEFTLTSRENFLSPIWLSGHISITWTKKKKKIKTNPLHKQFFKILIKGSACKN